jgi:MFS family permease
VLSVDRHAITRRCAERKSSVRARAGNGLIYSVIALVEANLIVTDGRKHASPGADPIPKPRPWLFITWLPSFFKDHYNLDLKNAALFSSAVFFAGVVGDTSGEIISDAILRRTGDAQAARRNVIVGAMIGAGICLGLVFTTANLTLDALFLAAGFFCLELVIGPIWSIPMDIAPQYAGMGSGLMNTGSAVAAIVSPLAFGLIVDPTGSWVLPFVVSIALLLLGCVMAFMSDGSLRRCHGRRGWGQNKQTPIPAISPP